MKTKEFSYIFYQIRYLEKEHIGEVQKKQKRNQNVSLSFSMVKLKPAMKYRVACNWAKLQSTHVLQQLGKKELQVKQTPRITKEKNKPALHSQLAVFIPKSSLTKLISSSLFSFGQYSCIQSILCVFPLCDCIVQTKSKSKFLSHCGTQFI